MIIGGLIGEEDVESRSKVPFLGDLWLVGKLFQKHSTRRVRNEIVVALIPRIAPHSPEYQEYEKMQFHHAVTPLLDADLNPTYRPWECRFNDPIENPWKWRRSQQGPPRPYPTAPILGYSSPGDLPSQQIFENPVFAPPIPSTMGPEMLPPVAPELNETQAK